MIERHQSHPAEYNEYWFFVPVTIYVVLPPEGKAFDPELIRIKSISITFTPLVNLSIMVTNRSTVTDVVNHRLFLL